MDKKTFFYVTDMHGASILEAAKALKEFKNINIKEIKPNRENSKKFIKICDKLVPNLGVMKVIAKLIEERTKTAVNVSIYPRLKNSISEGGVIFIKQRIIENHSMITQIEKEDIPTRNSFEYKGIKYNFTIFEDEPDI